MTNRREHLEEQLRVLQVDVAELSRKLTHPRPASGGGGLNASFSAFGGGKTAEAQQHLLDTSTQSLPVDAAVGPREGFSLRGSAAIGSTALATTTNNSSGGGESGTSAGQAARLQRQLRAMTHERDNTQFRLQEATRVNEQLRARIGEYERMQTMYLTLQKDYEALQNSLEASESIRYQQKDLIRNLQNNPSARTGTGTGIAPSLSMLTDGDSLSWTQAPALLHNGNDVITSTLQPSPAFLSLSATHANNSAAISAAVSAAASTNVVARAAAAGRREQQNPGRKKKGRRAATKARSRTPPDDLPMRKEPLFTTSRVSFGRNVEGNRFEHQARALDSTLLRRQHRQKRRRSTSQQKENKVANSAGAPPKGGKLRRPASAGAAAAARPASSSSKTKRKRKPFV